PLLETVHALGLLSCFALLGTSRIGACIRWLSFQGILFGLVPLIAHQGGLSWRAGLLAAGNIALKGIGFPWLLIRLRARADTNREVQPFVSFVMSVLVELGVLLDAFVGVFVMGIAIYHINREFGSIEVDRLSALKG